MSGPALAIAVKGIASDASFATQVLAPASRIVRAVKAPNPALA